jgi:hypothetical protein
MKNNKTSIRIAGRKRWVTPAALALYRAAKIGKASLRRHGTLR